MSDLLLHTKSRIHGKNADVYIYTNRVEWAAQPRSTGYNVTALILPFCTAGLSLIWMRPSFKTQATEVIPASKISSIQTQKDGPINTKVTVVTSGNTIDFRTSHDQAATIRETLTGLALQ